MKNAISLALVFVFSLPGMAQEKDESPPAEQEFLKACVGVWDAEIEVWPQGPNSSSITFKGVETNRPYGKYWIASDFNSDFNGETMKVHSIVGYDLDRRRMVGTVIDHGPYSASMTGDYDEDSKTVTWKTEAKAPNGKPMLQKTVITQKNANERILVLSVPGKTENEFIKFMAIRYLKRK